MCCLGLPKFHTPCKLHFQSPIYQGTNRVQFAMFHKEYRLQEEIDELKRRTSDQNLALLPDYEQRVDVLKELSFIDEESRVQLKGRVACEVRLPLVYNELERNHI